MVGRASKRNELTSFQINTIAIPKERRQEQTK